MLNYSKSLLLLSLAVMGNFVAETLGCETQHLLNNSMLAKHACIIFIIYFTLNISTDKSINPFIEMKNSLIIWFFFILFTKMHIYITIVVFSLLCLHFVLGNFIKYYKKEDENIENIENIEKLRNTIYPLMGIFIMIGFTKYSFAKYKEYRKTFSLSKFIFGIKKCKNNG